MKEKPQQINVKVFLFNDACTINSPTSLSLIALRLGVFV